MLHAVRFEINCGGDGGILHDVRRPGFGWNCTMDTGIRQYDTAISFSSYWRRPVSIVSQFLAI